jgi:hypothetical protein
MKIKNIDVPYAQIPNTVLFDPKLSWKAKGVWAYIQAKPEDWDFSSDRMAGECTDGVKATRTGIQELIEAGYLITKKLQSGRVTYSLTEKAKEPKGHNAKMAQSQKGSHIKERVITKKEKDITEQSSVPWNLEDKLQEMEQKENSYLDIIATFIREKGVKIENSQQLSNVISRYCRVAKKLSGAYTNKQIFGASEKIKEENEKMRRKGLETIDWTLETLYKKLTK